MKNNENIKTTKDSENPADTFKGLSVRKEYGMYLYDEPDEEEGDHGSLQTRRIREQRKPSKHIAQGLHWLG